MAASSGHVFERIKQAYDDQPELPSLLLAPYFQDAVGQAQDSWRRRIHLRHVGDTAPGFATALSYYDGLRRERLPAALIQGLRDFFGAHTYRRIDRDGTWHTQWSSDLTEAATHFHHLKTRLRSG